MRLSYCVLILALAGSGCGGSLAAPDPIQPRADATADLVTISGWVYVTTPADTAISNAVVVVNEADGSSAAVVTNGDGFYRISVHRGSVTITASKEGYEAKQWQFDLLSDTVLNFSLSPQ